MPFRVTDDKVINSFGFRVLVSGIDTSEFIDNPIMLHEHNDDILPTGTWTDLSCNNGEMYASPVFDENDPFAVQIKNKVDKNIIKMASIGVVPIEWSDAPEFKLPGQELPTLVKSKLKEISTCTFGSVINAVKLIDNSGKKINLNTKNVGNYIKQSINQNNFIPMEKNPFLLQQIAVLGLSEKTTEAEALQHIISLNTENVKLKADLKIATDKNAELSLTAENTEKEVVLQKAVDEKKITLKEKEVYLKLSIEDIKSIVETKKAATNLAEVTTDAVKATEELMKLSYGELDKQGKLVTLKEQNFEGFKLKFKEQFNKEYTGK